MAKAVATILPIWVIAVASGIARCGVLPQRILRHATPQASFDPPLPILVSECPGRKVTQAGRSAPADAACQPSLEEEVPQRARVGS